MESMCQIAGSNGADHLGPDWVPSELGSGNAILEQLNKTGDLMRAIVEQSSDLVVVFDGEWKMVFISPACETLLGRRPDELIGRPWTAIVAPEDRDALLAVLGHIDQPPAQPARLICFRRDGSCAWMETRAAPLMTTVSAEPLIVLTMHDVTAQRKHEQHLQSSLRVKEVLLQEIHHRVKNNLQVIQSLLKMQSRLLPEGQTPAAIAATVQRVRAMALLHEGFYQREDLATISLDEYLQDLFDGAQASSVAETGQVQLLLDTEDIRLTLDTATSFGLLTNELLSNSFKHGFPNGRRGAIEITIRRIDGAVHMTVKDDGIGFPKHFDPAASASMGLKLAAGLAHQLGGQLKFTSDSGCRIELTLTRL